MSKETSPIKQLVLAMQIGERISRTGESPLEEKFLAEYGITNNNLNNGIEGGWRELLGVFNQDVLETWWRRELKLYKKSLFNLATEGAVTGENILNSWTTLAVITRLKSRVFDLTRQNHSELYSGVQAISHALAENRSIYPDDTKKGHQYLDLLFLIGEGIDPPLVKSVPLGKEQSVINFLENMHSVGWEKGDFAQKYPELAYTGILRAYLKTNQLLQ